MTLMEIFYFLLGILSFYSGNWYGVLFLILKPNIPSLIAVLGGIVLAWGHLVLVAPKNMPKTDQFSNAVITGRIESIPVVQAEKTQFILALTTLNGKAANAKVQMAWYNHPPKLHLGETWRLTVALKKPRNFLNPGSMNYALQLQAKHLFWTGYVKQFDNQLINTPTAWTITQLRERLGQRIEALAPDRQTAALINALTLGLTHEIKTEEWNLFRETGVTHLLVISGSHIALIAGMVFFVVYRLWAHWEYVCLRLPSIYVASVSAFFAALVYTLMAGFNVPAQRALVALALVTYGFLRERYFSTWQTWRYGMLGVVLIEPHAVLQSGFYLSFIAVAILFLVKERWQFRGWREALVIQIACVSGLLPLTLYWFSYGSLNGLIANGFAIPLVGFILVPLSLLMHGIAEFSWSWVVMKLLSYAIALLFKGLIWTQNLAWLNLDFGLYFLPGVLFLLLGLVLLVLIPLNRVRWLLLVGGLSLFFPHKSSPKPGEALIRVLDVGQGLSVLIQTREHRLLYDTGDRFYSGGDMGQWVILPFLKSQGIKSLDKIVISHSDKDHLGGLNSIQQGMVVGELLVDNPKGFKQSKSCHDYPQWEWDGVKFRFFPILTSFKEKNNHSCILQIITDSGRVLLTGDIEAKGESYLTHSYGEALQSDILLVPHHGSKTSSSQLFLDTVRPKAAIASLGYLNRFHFPHPLTVKRYHALGIPLYRTDAQGMITVSLGKVVAESQEDRICN